MLRDVGAQHAFKHLLSSAACCWGAAGRISRPVQQASQHLWFCSNRPSGPSRSSHSNRRRYLNDNFLSGSLPDTWSSPGAFPQLSLLRIDDNALTGTLPPRLGSAGAGGNASAANMPNLLVL